MTHHHQSPENCEAVDIKYFTLERLAVIQKIKDNNTSKDVYKGTLYIVDKVGI